MWRASRDSRAGEFGRSSYVRVYGAPEFGARAATERNGTAQRRAEARSMVYVGHGALKWSMVAHGP